MDMLHIGNANFKSGKDRVWIKAVGSGEISFGVSLPSLTLQDNEVEGEESDQSVKRFRVRLNKTDWSSTRVFKEALGIVGEERVDVWSGKIFGLTASTNYICEFNRVDDGVAFYTTHITTQPAPHTEQGQCRTTLVLFLLPLTVLFSSSAHIAASISSPSVAYNDSS